MTTNTTPLDPEDTTMLRILIVCAVLVAANACLFALFWLLDRRESKRQAAERDAAELRRKLTAPHKPGALSERLRAGPGAALLCESRSDSGSRCGRSPGHTGLHGCVEIMRDGDRTWPCAVYWADRPFRVASLPERPTPAPRGLDGVTVHNNRVVPLDGAA